MGFSHPVWDMLTGSFRVRFRAAFTLGLWFAMGAFVSLTLDHHFNFVSLSDQGAALLGGGVASAIALLVKAV